MTPADILSARKRLGMTQAQFAEALRLGKDGGRYIRRLEAGQQEPSGPLTLAIELLVQTRLAEAEGIEVQTKGTRIMSKRADDIAAERKHSIRFIYEPKLHLSMPDNVMAALAMAVQEAYSWPDLQKTDVVVEMNWNGAMIEITPDRSPSDIMAEIWQKMG